MSERALALRSTSSDWYNPMMGTQGLRARLTDRQSAACVSAARFNPVVTGFVAISLTLLPALAGCSSFSSSSSSAQTAAAPPPPSDEAGASAYPYPKQSLVELFNGSTDASAAAPNVPRPPSTYTPAGQPYPANQPAYGAPVAAAAPQPPPPPQADTAASGYPYPSQSLLDVFKDSTDSSPRAQNVPHPPSTYTPSAQQ
jgi:hypothetical protein